jgi:hypothetical protein
MFCHDCAAIWRIPHFAADAQPFGCQAFKSETVGLVTKAEFINKRNTLKERLEEEQRRSQKAATQAAQQVRGDSRAAIWCPARKDASDGLALCLVMCHNTKRRLQPCTLRNCFTLAWRCSRLRVTTQHAPSKLRQGETARRVHELAGCSGRQEKEERQRKKARLAAASAKLSFLGGGDEEEEDAAAPDAAAVEGGGGAAPGTRNGNGGGALAPVPEQHKRFAKLGAPLCHLHHIWLALLHAGS